MAQRGRLSRRRGWRKPPGAVVVARPSRWGNPFRVGGPHPETGWPIVDRAEAVALFAAALARAGQTGEEGVLGFTPDQARRELAGRDLLCWCPLEGPCHADLLIELVARPALPR